MKPQTIQIFLPEGSSTPVKEAELTNRLIKTTRLLRSTFINILLGVMFTCTASAENGSSTQSDSEWFVPDGVVYIPSDDKQVETVRKELEMTFSKHRKSIYKFVKKQSGYFFLGPLLSSRIRDESPRKVMKLRTVGYRVKIMEDFEPKFQGILAKTNKEKKLLSQLLSDWIGDAKKIKLRRLKPDELAFMWYFVSWDIKEPVFVLETDKHTFLVDVGAISENQLWIEEMSNPCYQFGFEEIMSPCLCFEVQIEEKKWSGGFFEKPQECGIKTTHTGLNP